MQHTDATFLEDDKLGHLPSDLVCKSFSHAYTKQLRFKESEPDHSLEREGGGCAFLLFHETYHNALELWVIGLSSPLYQ
jgi:hypothetical protein